MKKRLSLTKEISLKTLVCGSFVLVIGAAAATANAASAQAAPDFTLRGYAVHPLAHSMAEKSAAPGAQLAPQVTGVRPATTYALYVSPGGSDSNPGTADAPFRTIGRAASAAVPDTTVFVAPGNYPGGFQTRSSGSQYGRIYYVSTTRWGATIVPPSPSNRKMAWDNRGSYVDIVGFEVDGSQPQGGTLWNVGIYNGGSYNNIVSNYVHHVATRGCNSGGGSAIGVDSYYRGVKSNVIGNLVHDIGPAGCRYVQGIYMSTSGEIKNNVVYRVAEGAIHLWHDARDVIIANNTVADSHTGIIVGGGDYYHTSGPADYVLVYSNIVYGNGMGVSEQGRTGTNNQYRNNLVYGSSIYDWKLNNGLTHSATVSSDPLFVAFARSGNPDLTPLLSSPAIGRGSADHAPEVDFHGRPRNHATGFDIGALQH